MNKTTPALRPHQREGVDWLTHTPKALVADPVGLGKTPMVIGVAAALRAAGALPVPGRLDNFSVIWITEPMLVRQTTREFERFAPHLTVLGQFDKSLGTSTQAALTRRVAFPHGGDVLILGYDMAVSSKHWLGQMSPSLVVLDEVMAVKSKGARWSTIRDLTSRAPRVVAMTATPLENDPTELYNALSAASIPLPWDRAAFESRFVAWNEWTDNWGRPQKKPVGWQPGAAALVEQHLEGVMLRRSAETVTLDRPARVGQTIRWVPLSGPQVSAYRKAGSLVDPLKRHQARERAGLVAETRSSIVDELIRELHKRSDDEQAVVYCEIHEVLDIVGEALGLAGFQTVRIDGKVPSKKRDAAIRSFVSGESRILLASSVVENGLNLQHCRLLISLGSSWNPAREEQREGRICRSDSPHSTYEHLTLMPDTAHHLAKWQTLESKRETARAVGL